MNWNTLDSEEVLETLHKESLTHKIFIYKHSTRCSTSSMVLERLERHWKEHEMIPFKPYFLDLIRYRDLSNAIEDRYGVRHESPQLLIISGGKCTFHKSHTSITYDGLLSQL